LKGIIKKQIRQLKKNKLKANKSTKGNRQTNKDSTTQISVVSTTVKLKPILASSAFNSQRLYFTKQYVLKCILLQPFLKQIS